MRVLRRVARESAVVDDVVEGRRLRRSQQVRRQTRRRRVETEQTTLALKKSVLTVNTNKKSKHNMVILIKLAFGI